MQNVQKYRDVNYHYHYQYTNQMHLNQNNYNMYATPNPAYNNQIAASRQIQLSPSLSVPTSVSPVSGYFPALSDIYYQNNLAVTCQNLSAMPASNNESNSNQHVHTQILNQNNYINIQNNCNKVCSIWIHLFY